MTGDSPSPQRTDAIDSLIRDVGGNPEEFDGRLIRQIIETALKLIQEDHDTGQLKLITTAVKEMRYAYRVFNDYIGTSKISIFGSARTPEEHPDYQSAVEFSRMMAEQGWMSITGAGGGIMKAGHVGPSSEASFGLSIRLPFETTANEVIEGDPKLINFRYFFTRKLMFLSHSDAVAVFPGGFGTQDELFEALTLIQTGKSNIVPVVLVEGEGGSYWDSWLEYVDRNLGQKGMISDEDRHLFHIATDPADAVREVVSFYRVYHSSRYVGPRLVIRLKRALNDEEIETLNDEFGILVRSGRIESSGALDQETDHRDLPRLVFDHERHKYGLQRALIDRINSFDDESGSS